MKQLNKEEWEHWREMPNIPIDIWFSFYKEKGGYLDNIEDFTDIFITMINNRMTVEGSDGVMKEVSARSAFGKMKEYYDTKFGISDVQIEEVPRTGSRGGGEIFENL